MLARRVDLEGREQDRVRPQEAGRDHGRAAGEARRAFSRRSPSACYRESGRAPRSACVEPASTPSAASRRSPTTSSPAVLPGSIGPLLRDRARGIDPRDLELDAEQVSVSAEDTFETDVSDRAVLHAEVRRLSELVSERLRSSSLSGRTVTAKLRYGDFSIRTRSTTLAAAIDEAGQIADVACGLLDRGLRDRPGALRLVGVGVSSLSPYRQLTLEEPRHDAAEE